MAASSRLITDIGTVITNGPNAATIAKAIAAAGPIACYEDTAHASKLKLQEAQVMAKALYDVTNAADTANKALLSGIYDVLRGSGTPTTTATTDMGTVITNGPGTLTAAAVLAAAGPIMDYIGRCKILKLKFQELFIMLTLLHDMTDSTDSTNHNLIRDILLALA